MLRPRPPIEDGPDQRYPNGRRHFRYLQLGQRTAPWPRLVQRIRFLTSLKQGRLS